MQYNVSLQKLVYRNKRSGQLIAVMHQEAYRGRTTQDDREYDLMLAATLKRISDYHYFEGTGIAAVNTLLHLED